jgi:LPS sulfotransferase NodH
MLEETGRPRRPRDYFSRSNDPDVWVLLSDPRFADTLGDDRYDAMPTWPETWGVSDFEGFLGRALEERTTDNGVFGTKIMWAYFRDFVRLVRKMDGNEGIAPCDVPAAVCPNFGRFVWIRREDTLRQAVSLWKALQTWQWNRDAPRDHDVELLFSRTAIRHLKLRIDEHNAAWESFFERNCGVEPVKVVYEDFVADYEGEVFRILDELGIPIPENFAIPQPKMRRQADARSEEWVRLYHELENEREAVGHPSGR